jgi:agmatine deiminase
MKKCRSSKVVGIVVFWALLLSSCHSGKQPTAYYHPAEFEPNHSTCFLWSTDYYEIIPKLAGIISRHDPVTLYLSANNNDSISIRKILKKHNAWQDNVHFVALKGEYGNIWIRDYGPLYMKPQGKGKKSGGEKKLVQFNYFWTDPGFIADYAAISGLVVEKSAFNGTGGAREVNGRGCLILCEAHELDVNQPKSRQEIEDEMLQKLGLKKIIWLKKGLPQDDSFRSGPLYDQVYPKGVNGHVDEFCRFVDERTILVTSVNEKEASQSPLLAEAKKRLDENYKILLASTDQDGKKFNVIQAPIAPILISDRRAGKEGQIIASVTSYMNFIISNSMIVMPSYVSKGSANQELLAKEKKMESIFKDVFPAREIVRVRADTMNYYAGGFHCISIHKPL